MIFSPYVIFESTDELPAPVEAVAGLLEDIEGWTAWSTGITHAARLSFRKDWRKGLWLTFTPRLIGLPLVVSVTAYDRNRHIEWGVRTLPFTMAHGFKLTPLGKDRCRFHHYEHVQGLAVLATLPMRAGLRRSDQGLTDDVKRYFAR